MAYVDDCNSLMHHDNILFFLNRCVQLETPLGAILKRILTTTTGSSLVHKLVTSTDPILTQRGLALQSAIAQYSCEQVGDIFKHKEVTDGLPGLGCPIGSTSFCKAFLMKSLTNAKSDAKIASSLESLQTILRLYCVCTVHKLTHLFGCNLINSTISQLPPDIHLWNGELTNEFSQMTEDVITNIINTTSLPAHAHIIANMYQPGRAWPPAPLTKCNHWFHAVHQALPPIFPMQCMARPQLSPPPPTTPSNIHHMPLQRLANLQPTMLDNLSQIPTPL
jgi:hypothetical protein